MEEPGKQCTVVFALFVTEPVSKCVWGGGAGAAPNPYPPITLAGFVTIYTKTTVDWYLDSSMDIAKAYHFCLIIFHCWYEIWCWFYTQKFIMLTLDLKCSLIVQDPYHIFCFYKHKKFALVVGFGRAALTRLLWRIGSFAAPFIYDTYSRL